MNLNANFKPLFWLYLLYFTKKKPGFGRVGFFFCPLGVCLFCSVRRLEVSWNSLVISDASLINLAVNARRWLFISLSRFKIWYKRRRERNLFYFGSHLCFPCFLLRNDILNVKCLLNLWFHFQFMKIQFRIHLTNLHESLIPFFVVITRITKKCLFLDNQHFRFPNFCFSRKQCWPLNLSSAIRCIRFQEISASFRLTSVC